MNKKILALALAIVFIATAFTACKKGPELTEVNGKEYPLATDKDGQTVINDENQIAVLVTDKNNEVLTYENGENQTHWVQINGPLVVEDKLHTKEYTFGIPEGWEGDERGGRVVKKDTDEQCYINASKVKILKEDETFDEYLEQIDARNTAISEGLADEEQMNALIEQNPANAAYKGYKYTFEKSSQTLTSISLNCQVRKHKIVDKDGNLVHYAENYYFVSDKSVYKIEYICGEGMGYDESFSFSNYIATNFTFKAEKK